MFTFTPPSFAPTLFLVRGLPGAGKTTTAARMGVAVISADDYFTDDDGVYFFDPSMLARAHADCRLRTQALLKAGESVAVANTFTQRWEMQSYLDMAAEFGARVVVTDCFDADMTDEELAQTNVHGVPVDTIAAMRSRWEHDWRSGDTRAPWERK